MLSLSQLVPWSEEAIQATRVSLKGLKSQLEEAPEERLKLLSIDMGNNYN